jgi:RNA polymerase sigma factor (TIGR02999 family)
MGNHTPERITELLQAIHQGDPNAIQDLFSVVYGELRKMARARMAHERPNHTLQPTALVHEAYLRLLGNDRMRFENRSHFFAAAGEAMRRILIDHARKKSTTKRNAPGRIALDETMIAQNPTRDDLAVLDEAITRLQHLDRQMSDVLKLRFFVGLTVPETAEALGIAPRTVDRQWAAARAWLTREIRKK